MLYRTQRFFAALAGASLLFGVESAAQSHVSGWVNGRFDSRLNDETFTAVFAGDGRTLLRRQDGSLVGVGVDNGHGFAFPVPPAGETYIDAAPSQVGSVVLRSDGVVLVGASPSSPLQNVPPLPSGVTFVALEGSSSHVAALRSDGGLEAWGNNLHGQCNVPPLPPGVVYVEASAGSSYTLALRSDGVLLAFGLDTSGQLDVPTLAPGLTWVRIAAGSSTGLGLVSDGSLRAWGSVNDAPTAPAGTSFVDIDAAGRFHALLDDGRALVWNSSLQVSEYPLPPGRSIVQLSAGGSPERGVALLDDGQVIQALTGWGAGNCPPAPPGVSYRRFSSSSNHGLLLLGDGTVRAFGNNDSFQCNVPALPNGLVYTRVAARPGRSAALRNDGSVELFGTGFGNLELAPAGRHYVDLVAGRNFMGLLDDGHIVTSFTAPTLPPGLTYTKIAAGPEHDLALRSDGELIAWGRNDFGQCAVPPLPGGVVYVDMAGGDLHTLALRSDGEVVAFGLNSAGQCDVPALPPGQRYEEIGASELESIARRTDGTFVRWGGVSGIFDPPSLGAEESIRSFDGKGTYVIERAVPGGAPDLLGTTQEVLPVLSPGPVQDVVVQGTNLTQITSLALDGVALDPARYTLVNDGMLTLDLPQVAGADAHDLSATDGVHTDVIELTLAAPLVPQLEFEDGTPLVVVDRDDGLTFRLAGPVGIQQQIYLSPSNVPSTLPYVNLALGNNFTELIRGPRFVLPTQGLLEVHVPPELLPVPPPGGLTFYAQTLMIRPPLPFRTSNLQSFVLVP
jgi:hypothetical protein